MNAKSPEDLTRNTNNFVTYLQNKKKDTTVMEQAMMTAGVYTKEFSQMKKGAKK